MQGIQSPSDAGPPSAVPMSATVLHAGRRVALDAHGISIGRRSDNQVVIDGERVSRHHARIAPADGGWYLADLDSMNGTYLNGERLRDESRWLESGDKIGVGGEVLRFVTGEFTQVDGLPTPALSQQRVQFSGRRLTFGRDPSNDVVLRDPNVSRFHAEITPAPTGVELRDLGSSNGTRIDGRPVSRAAIASGAEIAIGPFRILFDGSSFLARDRTGALRLDAEKVGVVAGKRRILTSASLSVLPGELVAIIGESGSGKSTLIKALAGVTDPTEGRVSLSGEAVRARLTDVGYVPQEEIVHGALTVAEALRYSARLRLPDDAGDGDVEDAVARVLAEVDLTEHADTRIASLSGGQRKRASVAVELLSRPSLLFLDEPTTGLDPELETRLMQLLRSLASSGRGVTLVTHATKNLGLCDKLAVIGRGGELAYFGPPVKALSFFGAGAFDDIYRALREQPTAEWRRRYETIAPPVSAPASAAAHGPTAARRRGGRQARILAGRYLRLLSRDRRNLLILLGQVPLLALGMASLFKRSVFAHGAGHAGSSAQLLFLLVTTSIWLGSVAAARELVKERRRGCGWGRTSHRRPSCSPAWQPCRRLRWLPSSWRCARSTSRRARTLPFARSSRSPASSR
jgi:ABC transport system ATP-binding/permease protein